MSDTTSRPRIAELDALRGLAALAVVLYHYLTRYDELFATSRPLTVACPWGQYGVELFFMISGYVILMTLDRTATVRDFLWNRFARLYPAYWVAAIVTFLVTSAVQLPGQTVTPWEAILNLTMIPHLLKARLIDGVYWTLQAELLFYAVMLLIHRLGAFRQLPWTILTWLLVAAACHAFHRVAFGTVYATSPLNKLQTLGSLNYIQHFAVGIVIYDVQRSGQWQFAHRLAIGIAILISVCLNNGYSMVYIAGFALIFYGATAGHLPWLVNRPLVSLGGISYTLYLVHQNIGYAALRWFQAQQVEPHLAVAITTAGALVAATLLSRYVEQPALRGLRTWWKSLSMKQPSTASAPASS